MRHTILDKNTKIVKFDNFIFMASLTFKLLKVRDQPYLNAFGENLKNLIDKKGKTPEYVAANGDIETKQVYRVINGEHSPTLSVIRAIAKGLGIKTKELFDFDFD